MISGELTLIGDNLPFKHLFQPIKTDRPNRGPFVLNHPYTPGIGFSLMMDKISMYRLSLD